MTEDSGAHWADAAPERVAELNAVKADETPEWIKGGMPPQPVTVTVGTQTFAVKKAQFLTAKIGWALLSGPADVDDLLAVSADGGQSWHAEVTSDIAAAVEAERKRMKRTEQEAVLYVSQDAAAKTVGSAWTLLPDKAAPGDVVLVRSNEPGEIDWEGKKYALQPFGAGYFTYIPLSMAIKPGKYPIGSESLTIVSKKFETQYLQVTKQLESMKQDSARIAADQKKIDLARSQSKPEFLFSKANFIQPIEGILTTPYGYTRYVNGKFDSSHRALDLAAKEGTPIKATNDGIVALADSLYLTGNTIYIDHGMGLFSQYAHLSKLMVKTGDEVKQGDIIGLVGTTGFSTGPHLHFTYWAHNVPVNPNLFFGTTPFHWNEPQQEQKPAQNTPTQKQDSKQ
ncbi:M23 family metallopeptidase [Paenibacillus thalictri]|uniref:M23 family metallopeptidase n=2 Tax=Paenibacillus thalictri TaxID=2527873 RepID=A0A4Q9DQV5_9BACL|nr:M23 family metallopeptidase [Paenibacillus thalictri]